MRVVYVISSLAREGPVNVLYALLTALPQQGAECVVITLTREKATSRLTDFERLNVRVESLGEYPLRKKIRKLRRLVGELRPDVLHAHCPRSLLFLACMPSTMVKAYTAHVYPGVQQVALYGPVVGRVVTSMCNFLMRRLDIQLACSFGVQREFREKRGWMLDVAENGCTFPVRSRTSGEQQQAREKLGLRGDKLVLVCIGRLSDEKNVQFLLDVVHQPEVSASCELIVVGSGPAESALRAKAPGNVHFSGFVSDVTPYLLAADVYVSSSRTEGLPNALLEAMSLGLPVLVSDIPAHREVFERSTRQIGFLFDLGSSAGCISNVQYLLQMDRNSLAEGIRAEYQRRFTPEAMASSHMNCYRGVLGNV